MFDSLRSPPLAPYTISLAPRRSPLTQAVALVALGSLLWAAWLRFQADGGRRQRNGRG